MTISSTVNRVSYACDGVTKAFAFPYPYYAKSHIVVVLVTVATGAELVLALDTDYSLTDPDGSGGTVTTLAATAYGAAYKLVIYRDVPATQETDLITGGALPAEAVEQTFDLAVMMIQQLLEQLGRVPLLPVGSALSDIALPVPGASEYLRWNSAGDGLETADIATAGALAVSSFGQALISLSAKTYFVDPTVADQGALTTEGNRSIADLIDLIGSSKNATIVLPHTGSGNETTYTLDTDIDLSGNPNIYIAPEPGALFSRVTGDETITVYNSDNLIVSDTQQITAVDMIRFASASIVRPEWWGAVCDGTTDCYAPTKYSVASISSVGGEIVLDKGPYLFKLQPGPANPTIQLYDNQAVRVGLGTYLLSQASSVGVNGYSGALFVNEDQSGGNKNIALIGGRFKSAGDNGAGGYYDGGEYFAFKRVEGLRIKDVTILDVNGSSRGQIAYCTNVLIDGYYVDYEESWFTGGAPSYEDGLRIGSGCSKVAVTNFVINSGDDSIAINNEPSETGGSTTGADIHDISISNGIVTTISGHALRIYQEATMVAGNISNVIISNLQSPSLSGGDGLSIANYAFGNGPTIDNITISNYRAKQITSTAAGILVYNASRVTLDKPVLSGFDLYGIAANNADYLKIIDPVIQYPAGGRAGDGIIMSYCDYARIRGGEINNSLRHGVYIDDCDRSEVSGVTINTAAASGINIGGGSQRTKLMRNHIMGVTGANYAINEASGDYTSVINNDLSGNSNTIAWSGSNSYAKNNEGYISEAHGSTAALASGATFAHGLSGTPNVVNLSSDVSDLYWAADVTNVTVYFSTAGSHAFHWEAKCR